MWHGCIYTYMYSHTWTYYLKKNVFKISWYCICIHIIPIVRRQFKLSTYKGIQFKRSILPKLAIWIIHLRPCLSVLTVSSRWTWWPFHALERVPLVPWLVAKRNMTLQSSLQTLLEMSLLLSLPTTYHCTRNLLHHCSYTVSQCIKI